MEKNKIAITKTYNLAKPAEVLSMAKTLKSYIVSQKLFVNIKGHNYAMVEGWQFAGFISGLNVVVENPINLSSDKETKWSCEAKIYSGEKLVSVGYALCSSKETKKKDFDEYAILSMAQTRAIGKAFRNKIGWVMKLAGYEATPSEEMHKTGESQAVPIKEDIYLCKEGDEVITKQEHDYSMKIYGKPLCREHQRGAKRK